jgi:hypothetical protein
MKLFKNIAQLVSLAFLIDFSIDFSFATEASPKRSYEKLYRVSLQTLRDSSTFESNRQALITERAKVFACVQEATEKGREKFAPDFLSWTGKDLPLYGRKLWDEASVAIFHIDQGNQLISYIDTLVADPFAPETFHAEFPLLMVWQDVGDCLRFCGSFVKRKF